MKSNAATFVSALLVFLLLCTPVARGLSVEEEKKYGREIFFEIARSAPVNNDPFIAFYLQGIKDRIEAAFTLPFPIVLTVINSQSLDAFATPGGFIYVTTGLVGFCEKEEELAGVLSHEVAHAARRHVAKRLEKEKYVNVGMVATMLLAMMVGDAKTKEALLATGAASAQALALKYSREDEEEADRVGSTNVVRAGYSGTGVAGFLKRLRATALEKTIPQYLLTHPYHEDRIARVEQSFGGSTTSVDTSFFPFVLERARVLHGLSGSTPREVWINRFEKDRGDPAKAYGAALAYTLDGRTDRAVAILSGLEGPYRNLLLGSVLTGAGRFGEAVTLLRSEKSATGRYFLARAYEGTGNLEAASDLLSDLSVYGPSVPDIYYRLGMIVGRMGQEARGFENLGRYHLAVGRVEAARSNLEKAVSRYGINSLQSRELMQILAGLEKK